jgi:hypothetical protein
MSFFGQLFDVRVSPIDIRQRVEQDVIAAVGVPGVDMVVEVAEGFMQAEQAELQFGDVFG